MEVGKWGEKSLFLFSITTRNSAASFCKTLLTEHGEHGLWGLAHGLHLDHGGVVDGDLLEGQRVDFSIFWHVHHLAGVQTDVVFVPNHWDLFMREFNTELCSFTLLHSHIFNWFNKFKANTWQTEIYTYRELNIKLKHVGKRYRL